MKPRLLLFPLPLLTAILMATTSPVLTADEVKLPNGQVVRDVVTNEELTARLTENKDPIQELRQLEAKEAAHPPKPAKVPSLFDTSDFLCFSGVATLVPKGAVLHVPKSMQDRLHFTDGSSIKTWADFIPLNRAWITTVEVTRGQAEGNILISEETLKAIAKSQQVVIATLQGGPISVLPPKVPVLPKTVPGAAPVAAPAAGGQATPTTSAVK